MDLLGVNLKQEMPVCKVVDYSKMLFVAKKRKKQIDAKNKALPSSLPTKEIKFRAGIGQHDLERKINNTVAYLQKGHPCQITIMSKLFRVRENKNAVTETFDMIHELLKDHVLENLKGPTIRGGGVDENGVEQFIRGATIVFKPKAR
eukprot:CAMPEP_0194411048 /NCGR_PEP_ID=MMETSP0176-20130528/9158_1 /TAXON_ID=216777 /ORGANISM="Proboscia alata, Strain PI-D3" /LENGTH=146 /DNA_ID=CAMNT_0039212747 /DNA_START=399 /DNA_END=839 /DNA_ORIENTATION=-